MTETALAGLALLAAIGAAMVATSLTEIARWRRDEHDAAGVGTEAWHRGLGHEHYTGRHRV